MGTHARVNIVEDNKPLVSVYCQFDGYPSGLGVAVAKFAAPFKIVNGYQDRETTTEANGMGCFAALLIKHLKEGIGNVYIRTISDESQGEEFSYNLSEKEGKVWMTACSGCVTAFGFPGNSPSSMKQIWAGFCRDFDGEVL